jgi:hypothetical protein
VMTSREQPLHEVAAHEPRTAGHDRLHTPTPSYKKPWRATSA